MIKYYFVITLLFIVSACSQKINTIEDSSKNTKIVVKLKERLDNNIAFNSLYTTMVLSPFLDQFPAYYKKQINKLNIKDSDSVILTVLNTDYKKFYYDLYNNGMIDKESFLKRRLDSLKESKKTKQRQLWILSELKKNKLKITVDENNNFNFKDDKKVEFLNKTNQVLINGVIKDSLPLYNLDFDWQFENTIFKFNRKINIFPELFNKQIGAERAQNNNQKIAIEFKNYWQGKIDSATENYDVVVQGTYFPHLTILIKPDSLKFSKIDSYHNENFTYKLKDFVSISGKIFLIDSIVYDNSKLILTKVNGNPINYGYRIGQVLKNYELNLLNDLKSSIYEVSKDKDLILLDFWSTTCKPCLELTPELISIYNTYKNKLEIISVAYDKSREKVIKYTLDNKMIWINSIIERKLKGIVKGLNISTYPTFILINSDRKIVYRGVGKEALEKVKNILQKAH